MNRLLLITIFLLTSACRKDMPREWKAISNPITRTIGLNDSLSEIKYDSMLTALEKMQTQIYTMNTSENRMKLLNMAFDSTSDCFFTVGKGVANREFPMEAQNASRKTASKINSELWALHLKQWSSGTAQSPDTKISGQILYSRIIYEKVLGDTLLMLIQIPIGSVCIENR